MKEKRLYRSNDRMIGGVCAGLAEYFGIDKSLVRIVFALLIFAGTVSFWVYLLMWLIIPPEPFYND
jgi:phage shock protein PspC (stress-responsive transcriptional regulator)